MAGPSSDFLLIRIIGTRANSVLRKTKAEVILISVADSTDEFWSWRGSNKSSSVPHRKKKKTSFPLLPFKATQGTSSLATKWEKLLCLFLSLSLSLSLTAPYAASKRISLCTQVTSPLFSQAKRALKNWIHLSSPTRISCYNAFSVSRAFFLCLVIHTGHPHIFFGV